MSDFSHQEVYIAGARRTAIGNFQSAFAQTPASQLGAVSLKATVQGANFPTDRIQGALLGCVLSAGQGQAPARQAVLGAGLPQSFDVTTINKVCGSGMKAIMLAHALLRAGQGEAWLAGGMENMSLAPYLLDKARAGYRFGHAALLDHMLLDGLEDAYQKGTSMGLLTEKTAEVYGFSREMQDAFAIESVKKAQHAQAKGWFSGEIIPVAVKKGKADQVVNSDEGIESARIDKIPALKPAFKPDGTVTAANASSISDGAASVLVLHGAAASGATVEARIVGYASHAHEPARFATAPVGAIEKLLHLHKLSVSDIDLWEINEAFAVVPMAAMRDLNIPSEKVNIHGGACVLGHPIGASGARIVVTLLHALRTHGLKRGVAAACIGGGEATAILIERV